MNEETISSREFSQNLAGAKRAALMRPVMITDDGRLTHVLLSIAEYRRLSEWRPSIADLLRDDQAAEVELLVPSKNEANDWR